MEKPTLIIVLGPPAAGKTTLAQHLSENINVPVMGRDQIKELIFDTLGWSDQVWNDKVTKAGYSILYNILKLMLSSNNSLIVESNFSQKDGEKFTKLQKKYGFKAIQIICTSQGDVLVERFRKRAKSGERHPGHTDQINYQQFKYENARQEELPLELEGPIFHFDTTNLENIDYSKLFNQVKKHLS